MSRISFLSLQRPVSLSPISMGYPTGYADVFFPNAFLHLLFFLGYIRSLIFLLFRFLHLSDLLETSVISPQSNPSIFDDRSVSKILIEEFVPVIKFSEIAAAIGIGFSPEICAVCLCDFGDADQVRCLKNCKHVFHRNCFDRWIFRDQKTCPLCRTLVVPDESVRRLLDFSGCPEFSGDCS